MSFSDKISGIKAVWGFDNRWQLVANRLLFPRAGSLVYKTGEVEFLVDHNAGDASGTRLCIVSDLYKRFLPLMKLPPRIRVFDLGANSGGFALMLLLNGRQFSQLLCVEMNPNTFRRLDFNIHQNISGDVRALNAAVCGARKTLQLSLGKGRTSDSIYQTADGGIDPVYTIKGYTFDELFQTHFAGQTVDICKMDIEGAEYEIFASGTCTELRRCRYLIMELHDASPDQQDTVREALKRLEFTEIHLPSPAAEHLFANTCLV